MKNGRRDFVRHAVLRGGAGVLLTVALCLSVALALDFLFSLAAPWQPLQDQMLEVRGTTPTL